MKSNTWAIELSHHQGIGYICYTLRKLDKPKRHRKKKVTNDLLILETVKFRYKCRSNSVISCDNQKNFRAGFNHLFPTQILSGQKFFHKAFSKP